MLATEALIFLIPLKYLRLTVSPVRQDWGYLERRKTGTDFLNNNLETEAFDAQASKGRNMKN